MIPIGTAAPDFEAPDSLGRSFRLSSLRGHRVILYFFPKAFTLGCTVETERFAALAPELEPDGVRIVGVSVDPPEVQGRFAERCRAPFPIVSDRSRAIARSYGVLSFLGVARRVTFFLTADGTVEEVAVGLGPGPHVTAARALYGPGR